MTGPDGRPIEGLDGEPDEAPSEGPNEESHGENYEGHGGGSDGGTEEVPRVLRKVEAGERGSLFSSLVQQTQLQPSLVSLGSHLVPSSLFKLPVFVLATPGNTTKLAYIGITGIFELLIGQPLG